MNLTLIGLAIVTFLSTLIGGTIAIKYKRALPYLFAFSAGTLIAVSFFDILPESLELAGSINMPARSVMTAVVLAFLAYTLLEKYVLTHHHEEEGHGHIMGPIGAGGLVLHSFLDGAAIGSAFQVNYSVGTIVALAVVLHDFTDGVNTVTLMLKNKHTVKNALTFLALDALAPVLGVVLTSVIALNTAQLALLLALFAGEFLYIGAANLVPETHKHTSWKILVFMAAGMGLIYVATSLVS